MNTRHPVFAAGRNLPMNSRALLTGIAALVCVCACATAGPRPDEAASSTRALPPKPPTLREDWKPFAFLVGSWEASGGGAAGASTGSFSFQPDVQGLSYALNPDGTLLSRFEIAPPGADFRTYLEGTGRRSLPRP
jgi:hypothetical protein